MVIATTFGTDLQAQTSNIITCVQSYVLNEPTDCGESEPEDSLNVPEYRIGPLPSEWVNLNDEERHVYKIEYLDTLAKEFPDIVGTNFYTRVNSFGTAPEKGVIYGVFNDSGELLRTYSIGNTNYRGELGNTNIRVNSEKLIPEEVIQKSQKRTYTDHVSYYTENGEIYYSVFK